MSDDKFEVVARVPRNATSEMLIKKGNYWNIDVLDVRWYSDGKPTKKGIRMNLEEAEIVMKAIKKIIDVNKNDDGKISKAE
tara:strand:+ start:646 stop:888 length:243 start_codon:yes stop_codon:yes gene_type:complete